jgi:hypothetical protein
MTLGRLMELYQAEQQGKQIMVRVFEHGYYESHEYISKIKLLDEELKDLVLGERDDDETYTYFIKDEEDEYGNKLNYKKK